MTLKQRSLICILAVSLLTPSVARAGYRDTYKEGMKAYDRADWPEVVRLMQQAIRENPQAGGRGVRLRGTRFEDYLPYYHLGVAFYSMNRFAEALKALDDSLAQGAIGGSRQKNEDLVRLRSELMKEQGLSAPQDTVGTTRSQGVRSQPPRQAAPAYDPQVQVLLSSLSSAIGDAENLMSQATPQTSARSVSGTRQRLAQATTEARLADATSSAAELSSLESTLRSRMRELRAALAAAPPPVVEPDPAPTPDIPAPPAGPPDELREAATSYFRGDHEATLRRLEETSYDDTRASLQVGLLRAAALYRQYLIGSRSDESLLQAALDEVADCRSLDPSFQPDARYFSPGFVVLFVDGR